MCSWSMVFSSGFLARYGDSFKVSDACRTFSVCTRIPLIFLLLLTCSDSFIFSRDSASDCLRASLFTEDYRFLPGESSMRFTFLRLNFLR